MPIYEYYCPGHDLFEVWMTKYEPLDSVPCPRRMCGGKRDGELCPYTDCKRVLSTPGGVIVEGGTGARRGN